MYSQADDKLVQLEAKRTLDRTLVRLEA